MIITIFLWLIYFFIFYSYGLGMIWLLRSNEKQGSLAAGLPNTVLMELAVVTDIMLLFRLFLLMQIPAFSPFYPKSYPQLPSEPCSIGHKTLSCVSLYKESWYSPFPCIPQ